MNKEAWFEWSGDDGLLAWIRKDNKRKGVIKNMINKATRKRGYSSIYKHKYHH